MASVVAGRRARAVQHPAAEWAIERSRCPVDQHRSEARDRRGCRVRCSTGGRQAVMEASRYPADFDGIIAGAAANPKTHLDAWRLWIAQAMFKDQGRAIPPSKVPMIHQAVLGACDALDGLKDGLIDNPTRCRFDPKTIECKGADASSCLTPAQVHTAKVVMSPVRDRQTGAEIFPGFEAGTELAWAEMLRGPEPLEMAFDQYKY